MLVLVAMPPEEEEEGPEKAGFPRLNWISDIEAGCPMAWETVPWVR